MKQYTKEYSIEWTEECEANSFEEAERILDERASHVGNLCGQDVFHGEIEVEEE